MNQRSQPRAARATILLLTAAIVLGAGCARDEDPADESARQGPTIGRATGGASETAPGRDGTDSAPRNEPTPRATALKREHSSAPPPVARTVEERLEFFQAQGQMVSPRRSVAALLASPADIAVGWPVEPTDRDNYAAFSDNPVRLVSDQPVSTFSIDVDTGSYANVRRFLNQGQLPPGDAVRVEELINYFGYDYPAPTGRDRPFSIHTEIAPAPWNDEARLLAIGIRGYDVAPEERPAANLVFLIDVSGSMQSPDKLPLLKNGFRLLARRLDGDDRVSIVVYAGASGLVLEPTPGDEQFEITAALDRLAAGGSTNGGDGIRLAYGVAADQFIPGGINRVVLATDGDFNVGTVSHEALIDLIERNRERGIALTTLGFGHGNYNDHLLEQLADHGNGNYAYIDTLNEARKVLVEELTGTLQTIASDVKIQIEFNPATVAEYRLIGYENRALRREDFNNDRIDAGEIGAGHTVTALYELKLADSADRLIDPLRYGGRYGGRDAQAEPASAPVEQTGELAHLRLRFKPPEGGASRLIERPLRVADATTLAATSDDFRFAAAVAAFGQALRGGDYLDGYTLAEAEALARNARGEDPHGYRSEFVSLLALTASLVPSDRLAAHPVGGR
jgi:Ca-activated chloride channel family protein